MSEQMQSEQEGWWNDEHNVYTWPITVGEWGSRIECHGRSPVEAQALAFRVVDSMTALAAKDARIAELEGEVRRLDAGWHDANKQALEQKLAATPSEDGANYDKFYAGLYHKSSPMWKELHDLAVSKGYDHVRFAIECAPAYKCDCRGARKVAIGTEGNTMPCECVEASNGVPPSEDGGDAPRLKKPHAVVKPCRFGGKPHWTHSQTALVYSTEAEAQQAADRHNAHRALVLFNQLELRTQPARNEAVIDLDALAWESIKEAANNSPWMPEQYMLNDWVADVCAFLREPARQEGGDVYKQHPAIIGYARKSDLAPLLDKAQPGGSHICIGLDHPTCWEDEPPYEHLVPLYISALLGKEGV